MNHVKGILLDIGWTMCYPPSGNWMFSEACMAHVDQAVLQSIPKERLESAYGAAREYLDDNHLVLTEDVELARFKTFYTMLAEALPELSLSKRDVEEIAADKVYNMDNYIFYDDVRPTLEELKKHYRLGVLSDTWPSTARLLKCAGISDYFDTVTFSCNLGVYKPDKRMYEHAIQSLGLSPEETIFVDDLLKNLEGADAHGITPVLIARENNPLKVSPCRFRKISTLHELEEI